ncbi:helix-turn-helix domain-containing protein [Paenibacillus sp. 1P07SE]|uniref:helix-turn-helix transcriptional regulator n=1 Tax=Paenibacillus sp. 1P07SE TaxID=3132209 RepID=UPI0039A414AB
MGRLEHAGGGLGEMQMHPKFVYRWIRRSGWRMEQARNPYMAFWLVLGGEGRLTLHNEQYKVREGDLVSIPPNETFDAEHAGDGDAALEYMAIGCDCRVGSLHLSEYYPVRPVAPIDTLKERMELQHIFAELQGRWEPFVRQARPELAEYIRIQSLLHHWLAMALHHLLPGPAARPRAVDERVERLCSLLRERYADKWTLREMAAAVHLSESHLRCLFKRSLQLTPMAYLLRVRLLKAKEQMQRTDEPIRMIAEVTGFEDWNYFSRVFRKVEGVAPSVYRRKHAAT